MQPHRCQVEAVIERPKPAPWIVQEMPPLEAAESWPGGLLDWRWIDKPKGLWVALVRYRRDGLTSEHAVNGDLLTIDSQAPDSLGGQSGAVSGHECSPV